MQKLALIAILSFFIFLGCATLENKEGKEIPSVIAKNISVKEPIQQDGNGSKANQSGEVLVGFGNASSEKKEEILQDISAPTRIPRSASDRIYEGSFDIKEPFAEPMKIHFINAGFADSILVEKGEFRMLIDSGNGEKVGEYLNSIGITKLDVVVATHDDPSAIAGMLDIFDNYQVGELWKSDPWKPSDTYTIMLAKARAENAAIKNPEAGEKMVFGGMEFFILNPPKAKGKNNNPKIDSIVMKIKNGEFCVVLLNPAVQEMEPALISVAQLNNESLRCDVITYFNHGEARAIPPSILEHANPKDVIIFAGENEFGLPSPTTLRMLEDIQKRKVWLTSKGPAVILNYGFRAYDLSQPKG
ncbi:MAG: MBL fold metallo-hydrolase [Candidatus Anstonellaceae archaeon]